MRQHQDFISCVCFEIRTFEQYLSYTQQKTTWITTRILPSSHIILACSDLKKINLQACGVAVADSRSRVLPTVLVVRKKIKRKLSTHSCRRVYQTTFNLPCYSHRSGGRRRPEYHRYRQVTSTIFEAFHSRISKFVLRTLYWTNSLLSITNRLCNRLVDCICSSAGITKLT